MAAQRPKVHVVATGGSISGLGPHRLDYILYPEIGQRLSIEEMLARIPEAHDIAEIQAENLIRVGSTSIQKSAEDHGRQPVGECQKLKRITSFRVTTQVG